MQRRTRFARPSTLARALDAAVSHALFSAMAAGVGAACGGQSAERGAELLSPDFSFPNAGAEGTGEPAAGPSGREPERDSPGARDRSADACAPPGQSSLAEMKLARSHDFVALRSVHGYGTASVENMTELEAMGQPCLSASDALACREALKAAWPAPGGDWTECGQAGCVTFGFVTTQDDRVELHQRLSEIRALLGDIDTPVEAVLWADANGYEPRCAADSLFQLPAVELVELEAGYRLRNYEMVSDCPIEHQGVVLDVARDGRLNEVERFAPPPRNFGACVGRRPPGLVASTPERAGAEVGDYYASVAALEAAAVTAFCIIEAELEAFGAPAELRASARRAAADEERHFATTSALASAHGAVAARPHIEPRPLRSLFDFALDNIVEGCVREAFGAAVAEYQAASAADPRVRALLASIAADERRHAELSFRVHAWLEPLLDESQLARLESAAERAIAELRAEHRAEPSWSVRRFAGAPSAAAATRLIDALEATLWRLEPRAA